MRRLLCFSLLLYFIIGFTSCNSQSTGSVDFGVEPKEITSAGLSWFSIEDLEKMQNVEGRKVLVDMYTTWCGYCKMMDKKTFTDPNVVKFLNENFVLVKFDAEQTAPITFMGEEYKLLRSSRKGQKGVNKLAMKLMSGRMSYPTMVYLDDSFEVITTSIGYMNPEQFLSAVQTL